MYRLPTQQAGSDPADIPGHLLNWLGSRRTIAEAPDSFLITCLILAVAATVQGLPHLGLGVGAGVDLGGHEHGHGSDYGNADAEAGLGANLDLGGHGYDNSDTKADTVDEITWRDGAKAGNGVHERVYTRIGRDTRNAVDHDLVHGKTRSSVEAEGTSSGLKGFGQGGFGNYGGFDSFRHGGSDFDSFAHGNSGFSSFGNHNPGFGSFGNYDSRFGNFGNLDPGFGSFGNHDSGFGSFGNRDPGFGSFGNHDSRFDNFGHDSIFDHRDSEFGSFGNSGSSSFGHNSSGSGTTRKDDSSSTNHENVGSSLPDPDIDEAKLEEHVENMAKDLGSIGAAIGEGLVTNIVAGLKRH